MVLAAEVYVVKRPQELVTVMHMSPELKVGAWSRISFCMHRSEMRFSTSIHRCQIARI